MKIPDIRNHGKYLDLWSVNHFLSGVVYAGWMQIWGFSIWFIFVTYFILAVGWEFYEVYAKVPEQLGNKTMDVVTGIMGFFLIYFLKLDTIILMTVSAFYLVMEIWCYLNHQLRIKASSNTVH